jgi:hypothetical protein
MTSARDKHQQALPFHHSDVPCQATAHPSVPGMGACYVTGQRGIRRLAQLLRTCSQPEGPSPCPKHLTHAITEASHLVHQPWVPRGGWQDQADPCCCAHSRGAVTVGAAAAKPAGRARSKACMGQQGEWHHLASTQHISLLTATTPVQHNALSRCADSHSLLPRCGT